MPIKDWIVGFLIIIVIIKLENDDTAQRTLSADGKKKAIDIVKKGKYFKLSVNYFNYKFAEKWAIWGLI